MKENAKFFSSGFPARLKQARLDLTPLRGGYVSPEVIAEGVGVSPQTIRNYENADGGTEPSLEMVERLAAILRIAPGVLAFGDGATLVAAEPYSVPEDPKRGYSQVTRPGSVMKNVMKKKGRG